MVTTPVWLTRMCDCMRDAADAADGCSQDAPLDRMLQNIAAAPGDADVELLRLEVEHSLAWRLWQGKHQRTGIRVSHPSRSVKSYDFESGCEHICGTASTLCSGTHAEGTEGCA